MDLWNFFEEYPENFTLNLENISTDTFCQNEQFDGGDFKWVSENIILFEEKLELYICWTYSLPSYNGDYELKKRFQK